MIDSTTPPDPYRPGNLEVVRTRDGSATLYDPQRDAHFSSLHGARTESRHIFLDGTGLAERSGDWRILELGFGAGINLRETLRARSGDDGSVRYHGVDYAPVSPDDVEFADDSAGDVVRHLLREVSVDPPQVAHRSGPWGEATLHPTRWCDLDLAGFAADVVFFDPFGPKCEPASWRTECFEVARRHLADTGVLATYSAASDVKRAMFRAGLSVATAPGPGPKREITYAAPRADVLESIDDTDVLDRNRYLDGGDE